MNNMMHDEDKNVRIHVVIEDDADKQKVIDAVCLAMEHDASFKIRYTKLGNHVFTADIAYEKIDLIKKVTGVKRVDIAKKAILHMNG